MAGLINLRLLTDFFNKIGQLRPRLLALASPDVGYASINDQSFAAPRLVAAGH
jgi:hypothetical protein